jgi:dihydroorotate dehydrogenase electron transfer subunit
MPDAAPTRYLAPVVSNDDIIAGHKVVTFVAPEIAAVARPGHFVNVLVSDGYDPFLRKPFSIYRADPRTGHIAVLYSIVGRITTRMARLRPGDLIDFVGPLGGRLFDADTRCGARHIMVGGGYGVPPLVFFSHLLRQADPGVSIIFLIGARRDELLLCDAELAEAGFDTQVSTEDGSRGFQGRVTEILEPIVSSGAGKPTTVYCCGPAPMMEAVTGVCARHRTPCQVSIEVGMPCGLGVCMGCVIDLKDGRRVRSCIDGPVFPAEEIVW